MLIAWLLPTEWSFEDLLVIWDIKKKVWITQEEIIDCWIKTTESGATTRDSKKDKDKKITFSDMEKEFIKKELKKLSDNKKLTENHLELYKEFVK